MKTDEVFLNQTGLSATQTVDAVEKLGEGRLK